MKFIKYILLWFIGFFLIFGLDFVVHDILLRDLLHAQLSSVLKPLGSINPMLIALVDLIGSLVLVYFIYITKSSLSDKFKVILTGLLLGLLAGVNSDLLNFAILREWSLVVIFPDILGVVSIFILASLVLVFLKEKVLFI
jgi:uncharacterized membrane protein